MNSPAAPVLVVVLTKVLILLLNAALLEPSKAANQKTSEPQSKLLYTQLYFLCTECYTVSNTHVQTQQFSLQAQWRKSPIGCDMLETSQNFQATT